MSGQDISQRAGIFGICTLKICVCFVMVMVMHAAMLLRSFFSCFGKRDERL